MARHTPEKLKTEKVIKYEIHSLIYQYKKNIIFMRIKNNSFHGIFLYLFYTVSYSIGRK